MTAKQERMQEFKEWRRSYGRKQVGFRFLSEPDMIKAGVLDVKKCVEVMDDTFKLLGAGVL